MYYDQIIGMLLLGIFYSAYMLKSVLQRTKGIQTNQLGKGHKPRNTVKIEKILHLTTILVVPVEVVSIVYNQGVTSRIILVRIGLVLVGIGIIIFCMAMWQMRDNWRAGIPASDQTELVTIVIYRWSRNPAFLGFDLTYIGILIAFYNPILLVITLWVVVMMHLQIREEEKFLRDTFKEKYSMYCQKTGRYLIII